MSNEDQGLKCNEKLFKISTVGGSSRMSLRVLQHASICRGWTMGLVFAIIVLYTHGKKLRNASSPICKIVIWKAQGVPQ